MDATRSSLSEQYRPRTWDEVLGQDRVLKMIRTVKKRGVAGRAFWISGQSGTGKTTIARLLAQEIAEDLCIDELDATDLTPARLREVERTMWLIGFGRGGRAYVINEAHGLRRDTIRRLLVVLERLPRHVVVIFTTTNDGEEALFEDYDDAHPLLSRCVRLPLSRQGLAQVFAMRAREIAQAEGLDGKPDRAYLRLVQSHHNNMRAVLQAIEAGAMMAE